MTLVEGGGHTGAISWQEAWRLAGNAETLRSETVGLGAGIGRVLAQDIAALQPIPHYASSAMDGWAVFGDGPWSLSTGDARPIVTGGLVPDGATAILQQEHGSLDGDLLRATIAPAAGRHIRPAGEEAAAGSVLIREGQLLNPAHIAVIAACGHDVIEVVRQPYVALLLTGDEVVESGLPEPGRVRDSFGPQLPTLMGLLGAVPVASSWLPDDVTVTTAALLANVDADVIVTTGGTGHSNVDHLRTALAHIGANMIIDAVQMRPGGPSLLARLPDGRYVVGLPGNPLAAMMGVLTLAGPLLGSLAGRRALELGRVGVAHDIAGRAGTTRLVAYRARDDNRAEETGWHGAGMMRGLAEAAGVLIVPPDGLREGEIAETISLPWT